MSTRTTLPADKKVKQNMHRTNTSKFRTEPDEGLLADLSPAKRLSVAQLEDSQKESINATLILDPTPSKSKSKRPRKSTRGSEMSALVKPRAPPPIPDKPVPKYLPNYKIQALHDDNDIVYYEGNIWDPWHNKIIKT